MSNQHHFGNKANLIIDIFWIFKQLGQLIIQTIPLHYSLFHFDKIYPLNSFCACIQTIAISDSFMLKLLLDDHLVYFRFTYATHRKIKVLICDIECDSRSIDPIVLHNFAEIFSTISCLCIVSQNCTELCIRSNFMWLHNLS